MEFGEAIKTIRQTNQLTQEKFANQLNVTRQAVSNWENNRNLPDLEMLITISQQFQISLDTLILGGTDVNNMTDKLIKDGSETRRARFNLITALLGTLLLILGLTCFFIKATSVEYIDAAGTLHENFYLLPIGFLFLFAGIVLFIITGSQYLYRIIKNKH